MVHSGEITFELNKGGLLLQAASFERFVANGDYFKLQAKSPDGKYECEAGEIQKFDYQAMIRELVTFLSIILPFKLLITSIIINKGTRRPIRD